jgi:uncharacterized membrane protein
MGLFQAALIVATFLCSLVAGFLFAFAVVVMPGIRGLNHRGFIKAFQVMDDVIQNNQPIFMVVWLGSVITLIFAAVLGLQHLNVTERWVLIFTALVYLVGVQLPTFAVNIPLNNRLQSLDVDAMDELAKNTARREFEERWNRWNIIRAVLSCLVSALLIVLVYRY